MKNLAFIQESMISSLLFALQVAQQLGTRVATLPDLINIRTKTGEDSMAWNRWITPLTTLYIGYDKGRRVIVVAHHLGPLNTEARLLAWAQSGTKDKGSQREKYGSAGLPKISQKEFDDLLAGKYGEVAVIDFENYRHGFSSHLNGEHIFISDASIDPLLGVLLGPQREEFFQHHLYISKTYALEHKKERHAESKILKLEIKDQYGCNLFHDDHCDFPKGKPLAFLLTLGCPSRYSNHDLSISTEIRVRDDLDLGRFVVLHNNPDDDIVDVEYEPARDWKKCLVKMEDPVPDFFVLSEERGKLFADYPKDGNVVDTGEIMLEVVNQTRVGGETFFETPIHGSAFLKYHIDEVRAIAPPGANAYLICGEVSPGQIAQVPVQFYRVKVDAQRRILRKKSVYADLSLLLEINGIKT